ncbi:MAG: arylsulfatase [Caulobacter sp.]|nr:arylsulfatase [Caulobacter sp.]
MNRLRLMLLALIGLTLLAVSPGDAATRAAAPARPNIVVILVDDAGYTDFGSYGGEIATPTIDALATRGTRFSNFHASPMCAPSRAMLLTGVDSHTAGTANLPETTPAAHRKNPAYQGRLPANVVTVASRLQASGYHTYMAGKWHLGHGAADLPNQRGFDRSFPLDATGGDNWEKRPYFPIYRDADWFEDGKPASLPDDFYSSRFLVDRMIRYIDQTPSDGQPFFAYLPFLAIHIPIQAPAEYVARYEGVYAGGWQKQRQRRYEGAIRAGLIAPGTPMGPPPANVRDWNRLSPGEQALAAKRMAVNAGMLEAMDAELGRLVAHLKATGRYDNTLFVVLSDNGPESGDPVSEPIFKLWLNSVGYSQDIGRLGQKGTYAAIGPGWASAAAAPGALYKFYASEGGTRVPLIVAGPGVRSGVTARGFSVITDITPTLLEIAGASPAPAPAPPIVGKSLTPILKGAAEAVYDANTPVGMEAAGDSALWKGDLKLTRNAGPMGDPAWRLYDIVRDPGETRDLSAERPAEAAAMLADYRAYAARVGVAEVPAGYTADREIALNIGLRIAETFALPLILGLGLVAGLAGYLVWREVRRQRQDPSRGKTMGITIMRGLLGLTGLLALLIASRFWIDPAKIAATMDLTAGGPAGLGTLRADMAGFFGASGVLMLAAVIRKEARWLTPVVLMLGIALTGRVLNLVLNGPSPAQVPPMVIEAVLIVLTGLGLRILPGKAL